MRSMPNRGGAALFDRASEGPLAEWRKAIEDRGSFQAEREQHMKKMIDLAHAAVRAGQIDRDGLADLLEWLDCAKMWAQEEMAEAEGLGMFDGRDSEADRRGQGIVFGVRG